MLHPYVDYSSSAVEHMCDVAGIFVQGHMQIMRNACIPVFLVTLLIALGSYKAYIVIWLCDMCT